MSVHFVGIDWANGTHVAVALDEQGRKIDALKFANDKSGLDAFHAFIKKLEVDSKIMIGIEKHRGPVFHLLHGLQHTCYEIPPMRVSVRRKGQSAAGAKSDLRDAEIIAEVVRTDHRKMKPFFSESSATQVVANLVDERETVKKEVHAGQMRLMELLRMYFPALLTMWDDLTRPCALEFIRLFPTANLARSMTKESLEAAFEKIGYYVPRDSEKLAQALATSAVGCNDECLDGAQATVRRLATRLLTAVLQLREIEKEQKSLLEKHPDGELFLSIPNVQVALASSYLACFGSNRGRFENEDQVAGLAGIVPVTNQSGKKCTIVMRWACDHFFRNTATLHAFVTIRNNAWAKQRYDEARKRGKSHHNALRILARSWIRVIYHCWKNREPYDIQKHRAAADASVKKRPAA